MRRTGLIQPGSLFESKYRIRLAPGTDAHALRERLERRYATAGWEFKDRDRAAPGANRFFERMGQFLSLIGLTALVIAGIGVSNGVSSYLALKRNGIATLKVLGATSADIERIYLLQTGAIAAVAIGCGLAAGALLPFAIVAVAGDMLPVQPGFRLYPLPLANSAAYGPLIGLIFPLPPLARARTQPAAALFRAHLAPRAPIEWRSPIAVGAATAPPVPPGFRLYPLPLATSAAYGLLIGLIFTLPPLARARTQPAAAIFRAHLAPRAPIDWRSTIAVGAAAVALVALALLTAREPMFSAAVLAAVGAVLLFLLLLGWAVSRVARRVPRPHRPLLRLALANLYRPGAQTSALEIGRAHV